MGYKKPTTVKLLGEHPKSEYTRLPNGLIRDPGVTANGFRVAAYLLSLGDGWEVNQRAIAAGAGLGRDAVSGGVKNLIETGWLRHNEYRNEDTGHVYRHEYVIHRSRAYGRESGPLYGRESGPSLKELKDTGDKSPGYVGGDSVATPDSGSPDGDRKGAGIEGSHRDGALPLGGSRESSRPAKHRQPKENPWS